MTHCEFINFHKIFKHCNQHVTNKMDSYYVTSKCTLCNELHQAVVTVHVAPAVPFSIPTASIPLKWFEPWSVLWIRYII